MNDILIDADALIALVKNDDSNHDTALEVSGNLQKKEITFHLSPFTVAEAATVLSHKVSQIAAKKFLKEMRSLDLSVLELAEKNRDTADVWFMKQNKKGTSYFDCYNMALLDKYSEQISSIFSFDKVYKRNGFKLAE